MGLADLRRPGNVRKKICSSRLSNTTAPSDKDIICRGGARFQRAAADFQSKMGSCRRKLHELPLVPSNF